MNIDKLTEKLDETKQPSFRLKQIIKAVYQDGLDTFSDMTNLPEALRIELDKDFDILPFEVIEVLKSTKGDTYKALLKLDDDTCIETVLISPKKGLWSACISTQVGCALKCVFCATGKLGIKRNLTNEEITDQVLFWRQYIRENMIRGNFSNIVYMGMGEPFLNWENTCKSIDDLTDPDLFGFGSRSISVSTSGIVDKIVEFGNKYPQINLAISLHFANDEKRSKYMPINHKYDLSKIKRALERYFEITNRKVFIEYIMISGVNDSLHDAEQLALYIKSFEKNHLLHVNLIKYNATGSELKSTPFDRIQEFKNYLLSTRIMTTIRKSVGSEIKGACGQLIAGE